MFSEESQLRCFLDDKPLGRLETMCCPTMTFMWKNHLLDGRDVCETMIDGRGEKMLIRVLKGFRVTRKFIMFQRDEILYECPFCKKELVIPLGYFSDRDKRLSSLSDIGRGKVPPYKIQNKVLKEHLQAAKNDGPWPPK